MHDFYGDNLKDQCFPKLIQVSMMPTGYDVAINITHLLDIRAHSESTHIEFLPTTLCGEFSRWNTAACYFCENEAQMVNNEGNMVKNMVKIGTYRGWRCPHTEQSYEHDVELVMTTTIPYFDFLNDILARGHAPWFRDAQGSKFVMYYQQGFRARVCIDDVA